MDFQDRRQECSFRNIPFRCLSIGRKGGRQVSVYTYVNSDEYAVLDLGGKPREVSFKARVIGNDFDFQRESFRQALEGRGSGLLQLPTHSSMQLQVTDFSESESTSGNNVTEFSVSGIIFQSEFRPQPSFDSFLSLLDKIRNSIDSVSNQIGDLEDEFNRNVGQVFLAFDGVAAVFDSIDNIALSVLSLNNSVRTSVSNFRRELQGLSNRPKETFDLFRDVLREVFSLDDSSSSIERNRNNLIKLRAGRELLENIQGTSNLDNFIKSATALSLSSLAGGINYLSQSQTKEADFLLEELQNLEQTESNVVISLALQDTRIDLQLRLGSIDAFDFNEVVTQEDTNLITILFENRGSIDTLEQVIELNYLDDYLFIEKGTRLLV